MAVLPATHRSAGVEFIGAAKRYWLRVFPRVCSEVRHWRARAATIPDPVLRRMALENLRGERLNLDGAAAFAAFATTKHRPVVVRAQVAFQIAFDYVDTLSEHPSPDPIRNADRLHLALLVAVDPAVTAVDYYAYHPRSTDGGYLQLVVETCRSALRGLPSYASVAGSARRAALRMISYQSLNLNETQGGHAALARWASTTTPSPANLRWWEFAASTGSSISVFALIATAANRVVPAEDAVAIEQAYFPWIGSLHLLLDSLADRQEDAAMGQRGLFDYYASPEDAAARLELIAIESMRRIRALPYGYQHMLVLAGMTSHYLSMPAACEPDALPAARRVLGTIGGLSRPTMLVMGVRHATARRAASRGGARPHESETVCAIG